MKPKIMVRACTFKHWEQPFNCDPPLSPDLNPDPNNLPELDPKDAFLVSDLASAYGPSASQVSTAASGPSMNVPWLRKTEYLSSSSTANIPALREM